MSGIRATLLAGALAATAACATRVDAPIALPSVEEAQQSAFGGWVEVFRIPDSRIAGELIAATQDTIYLLSNNTGFAIPTRDLVGGKVVGYDSAPRDIVEAAALGAAASLATGWFFIVGAPIWMIYGGVASHAQKRLPEVKTPMERPLEWKSFARYARFPQGLPEGVLLDTLKQAPAVYR